MLNWNASNFYRTPCTSYASFTLLQSLPPVNLTSTIMKSITTTTTTRRAILSSNLPTSTTTTIRITNPTQQVAFFIRLRLIDTTTNGDIFPILWSDNYFSLGPNEWKEVTATYSLNNSNIQEEKEKKEKIHSTQFDLVVEVFNNISGL